MGVFNEEFLALYEMFRGGVADALDEAFPSLPVQYADFASWQRGWLNGAALDRSAAYWKQQLAGIPERMELPSDRPRPLMQTFSAGFSLWKLNARQVGEIGKLIRRQPGTTLYMALLAAFATLPGAHSGQRDVVVGSPSANRHDPKLERIIGLFVSTVAMRVRLRPAASFTDLLAEVRHTCLDAYLHQEVPFERLVEELAPCAA